MHGTTVKKMMWYCFRATIEPLYMHYDVVTKFFITF